MNAALFQTTFWHLVWVTDRRKPLFASPDAQTAAREAVIAAARSRGIRVEKVNCQDEHCHAFFELPEGFEDQAEELFSGMKAEVEEALLALNPNLAQIWDSRNFFERVELGGFGAVRDYVRGQERHHATTPLRP